MSDLPQYILSGLSVGCIYAFVALGLVVVRNVTGIFNFATGEYVMVGGMIMAVTSAAGWPLALCVVAAMAAGAGVAIAQERLTVAPVRGKIGMLPAVIATLGVGVALRGGALLIWKEDPRQAPPFEEGIFNLFGASLGNQVKWIYLTTGLALIAVVVLFTRTETGRAMRACAINPTVARLTGIRIGTMSIAAFALSGALCGLIAGVAVSQTTVSWDSGVTIGLVGFIAAALAGFDSPVKAVVFGLALGIVEQLAAGLISSDYRQAIVYGVLVIYLLARDFYGEEGVISRAIKGRRASNAGSVDLPEVSSTIRAHLSSLAERAQGAVTTDVPATLRTRFEALAGRPASWLMLIPVVLLVFGFIFPGTTEDLGELDTTVFILLAAMTATGLGLVMGLAGQFSLGQAGFVLVAGYTAAILTADHGWDPMAAGAVAVLATVVIGYIVGWLTLRLEGLNLALATLALLVIATVFVLKQESLTHGSAGVQGVSGLDIFGWEIEEPQDYAKFCVVILGLMLLIARNVWYSRTGRALRAIGIDQEAAESVGLNAWRLKLRVFVLGAGMAGVAGVLWAYYLQYAAPDSWGVPLTIELVTFVVVGGVLSPYGGVVGAVLVGFLQYWFRENVGSSVGGDSSTWEVVLNGVLIIVFVLVFKAGLVSIPRLIGERLQKLRGGKTEAEIVQEEVEESAAEEFEIAEAPELRQSEIYSGDTSKPVVVVDGLTKQFGNLIAVNGVSFELRPGQVTAMIGPNGAGKSTVVNMLSGTLLPSKGAVGVLGHPVVGMQPQQIAQIGLARTYQTPRLFEGMTVLETVMLARDRYGSRSWLWGNAFRTPRALRDEREGRDRAMAWLEFVGLADDADLPATSLPVGKQRMAEVARALATEPVTLLLDEPAAGLDGTETRALGELIRRLGDAGVAVLLVEHDMGMVMSIADNIVVLEEGKKISEGPPSVVGKDQVVVDAYLGVVHA